MVPLKLFGFSGQSHGFDQAGLLVSDDLVLAQSRGEVLGAQVGQLRLRVREFGQRAGELSGAHTGIAGELERGPGSAAPGKAKRQGDQDRAKPTEPSQTIHGSLQAMAPNPSALISRSASCSGLIPEAWYSTSSLIGLAIKLFHIRAADS